MDLSTLAGAFLAWVFVLILGDEIKRGSGSLISKLSAFIRRCYIIVKHHIFHHLPTETHTEPIYSCLDKSCDTLFVNVQELEPPEEPDVPEVFNC